MLTDQQRVFVETFLLKHPLTHASGGTHDLVFDVSDIVIARGVFKSAIEKANKGLTDLVTFLLSDGDDDLAEIAIQVGKIASQIPNELTDELGQIVADPKSAETKKAKVGGLKAMQAFLSDNDAALRRCDANPFGLKLNIRGEITDALAQVESALSPLRSG